ncbi:FAD-dependent monooxygenase [Paraburkholderia solisilvae]|uniref:3-(3-hydroxy-phenyl)propionate/3-hydroxycinnamic acid hydroxylase n=1 Tax=Paraburkholderia solisilvae TaxID=624376 RepID=A0A6J5EKS3_9BURK|nr:FAD-dependent monooxygenase [Paraburkholderia solisilvae]CAB3767119.1 3-(3-hydroxy-phenyl)propionate/3-hydroxycinnamic acid hydroxylase [Paraburkholderia solisilvae]
MQDNTDVLIVGAGPVGLLLATELRRDGIDACVIDQLPGRTFFCKALGVTARTLEIFDDIGVADAAIDAGVWLTGIETWQDGAPAGGMQVQPQGLPYGALSLAQFDTERLLEAALHQHGGRVDYGWTLERFSETADDVLARLRGPDGEAHTLRCRWLAGCDGSHSTVRAQLNLPYEGGRYPQTFALADVDVDWALPRGPMYRFNTSDSSRAVSSLAAVPVRGSVRRYRLSVIVSSEEVAARLATVDAPDLDQMRLLMQPALPDGTQLSNQRWSSVYRVSHRIAPSYGHGRAFIAGDAAHIHPPVGGQGMNTGLQDAHNLAWKLSLVARGLARAALLDSYSDERRPVGLDVVESTTRAMNNVLAQQTALPGIRETQVLIGYRGSPIVADDGPPLAAELPAPGDRLPDANGLTQAYVGHPVRLHRRIGRGRHVLIGYVDAQGVQLDAQLAAFADASRALHAALGSASASLLIAAPGCTPPRDETIPLLTDAAGAFATAFGAPGGTVWVVRPDGHIGWRSAQPSAQSLDTWLTQSHILA